MVGEMQRLLGEVRLPVLLVQGDEDPVVDPRSVMLLEKGLSAARVQRCAVPAKRHGILYEDLGGTQQRVIDYLHALAPAPG